MAKKAARNLVIVESPAKAKTIGKYLGPDYEVRASMGHLRDLPKSKLGVDVEHDFEPNYRPIRGKEELINELKKLSKASDTVYLATDPDREGEAISWHLKNLLDLSDEKAKRVTFNEITRKVVTESIHHPREIDQDLVDAQQARRILDRIVGYELSPLLWKKIRRGLSAGRVQSVAMRLVADREKEIKDFVPQEYWTLDALLKNDGGVPFRARYYGKDGKKYEPVSQEEVSAIQAEVQDLPFAVKSVKRTDKQRSPAPPFTTSTMQQDASRKLNMTPRRTMAIAQQLYEGVDITGEGTVGLITYMRTDSLRISDEAQAAARSFVTGRYGAGYCPAAPRQYKTKAGAQDAHEAIRPSDVELTPERVKSDLTSEQYRLYRLIWSRFLASQMSNAIYDSVSVELGAGAHSFRASASSLKFAGYTAVYEESRDDEKEEKAPALPPLAQGEVVTLTGFDPAQHFTQPPARFTDASLIRAMEENGIGRPSTYAPTVSTILDREYVIKDGKYLKMTPLGDVVNGLMCDRFKDIVDVKFTARMEDGLDDIEKGEKSWKEYLSDFYGGFETELKSAEKAMEGQRIKVYLVDVRRQSRGPQVVISRTHPGLVKRLFELEVPEIYDGTVEIRSIAREAGSRTKMAVWSNDENVDPIGACVGPHGQRVNSIVEELRGEKIDIIKYSDDPAEYIAAALAPADVVDVRLAEEGKACRVIVPDDQLSLAIGKEGQNARLAARLVGYKIDIKPESYREEE